jgi:hypothetical protein
MAEADPVTLEPESRWLLRWLHRLLYAALLVLAGVAVIEKWPTEKVGNAYQLLGLGFAALALPVLSPWLAIVEREAVEAKDATNRWLAMRRHGLRVWWARVRHKAVPAIIKFGGASSMTGGGGAVTVGHRGVDRQTVSERDWLGFLNDELDNLRAQIRALQVGRSEDRTHLEDQLDSLRHELQRHMLAVTREGWRYVATGAGVTAFGIGLALV